MNLYRTLLCVTLVGVCVVALDGQTAKPKNSKLQSKLKDLKAQEGKVRKKLNVVKDKMGDVRETIDQVDAKIDKVEVRFQSNESKLERGRTEQKTLSVRLLNAEKSYDEKSETARRRLRLIRMYGQVSFASALVGSKGVSDLASRSLILKKISDRDRELFEEVRTLRDDIEAKKRRSDILVSELKGLMADQRLAHAELTAAKQDKRRALFYLQSEASELQKMIRQFDAAEAEIENLINANSGTFTGKRPGRLSYPVAARITSSFGSRFHPILRYRRMHKGVDFGASHGTTIRSAADGIVIYAGRMSGYGNTVIVNHGGGLSTLYGHCSSISIANRAHVKRGQAIARVGSTGLDRRTGSP
ncbi:MAG: peptidoglycan DD-metalloendopeptidase family protein [Fimbriimonadaceae bacterium]